jgi:hypothetical protein
MLLVDLGATPLLETGISGNAGDHLAAAALAEALALELALRRLALAPAPALATAPPPLPAAPPPPPRLAPLPPSPLPLSRESRSQGRLGVKGGSELREARSQDGGNHAVSEVKGKPFGIV